MKTTRSAWLTYVALRLLFFVVPFGIVYALCLSLGFTRILSGTIGAVIAALIGVSLSVIFLSRSRAQAAQSIEEWRTRDRTADDIAEDAVLDGQTELDGQTGPDEQAVSGEQAKPGGQAEPGEQTDPSASDTLADTPPTNEETARNE